MTKAEAREMFDEINAYRLSKGLDLIDPSDLGEVSDGYHTFNELYEHRATLTAALAMLAPADRVWKSRQHADDSMHPGYFIVGFDTPDGPATYHYAIDTWWDRFPVREIERAPEWDGHTPADVLARITKLAESLRGERPGGEG